jgi:hypothetical protein
MFTIEASEWADEGVELQPLNDSMGIKLGTGAELFRFGYAHFINMRERRGREKRWK